MSWESEAEAELYRQTVHDNPIDRETETPVAYAARIAGLVARLLHRDEEHV